MGGRSSCQIGFEKYYKGTIRHRRLVIARVGSIRQTLTRGGLMYGPTANLGSLLLSRYE
jgi:hypothetical protein